jgi:hypothetical protein
MMAPPALLGVPTANLGAAATPAQPLESMRQGLDGANENLSAAPGLFKHVLGIFGWSDSEGTGADKSTSSANNTGGSTGEEAAVNEFFNRVKQKASRPGLYVNSHSVTLGPIPQGNTDVETKSSYVEGVGSIEQFVINQYVDKMNPGTEENPSIGLLLSSIVGQRKIPAKHRVEVVVNQALNVPPETKAADGIRLNDVAGRINKLEINQHAKFSGKDQIFRSFVHKSKLNEHDLVLNAHQHGNPLRHLSDIVPRSK